MVTKRGITVISYVHTARGLVDFEELTPEEKTEAATALKLEWMNTLYRGVAKFTVAASERPGTVLTPREEVK